MTDHWLFQCSQAMQRCPTVFTSSRKNIFAEFQKAQSTSLAIPESHATFCLRSLHLANTRYKQTQNLLLLLQTIVIVLVYWPHQLGPTELKIPPKVLAANPRPGRLRPCDKKTGDVPYRILALDDILRCQTICFLVLYSGPDLSHEWSKLTEEAQDNQIIQMPRPN